MLKQLKHRVSTHIARRKYAPDIKVEPSSGLLRLGSEYGGWTFEPSADLHHAVILSCGFGEDASFDVEFASRFDSKVIVVDPTPRAIRHFNAIQERLGQPSSQGYVKGGLQPVNAYDLRKIDKDSLVLEPSALWVENTTVKFFQPPNPSHVSHSITNFQNNYNQQGSHIEVPAITPETLLAKYHLKTVPLMKIDIEGAEIGVIQHLLAKSIIVRQLLVEFDEMLCASERSKENIEETDRKLRQAGYICRQFDGPANFLYVQQ
jgi:FkbM family methyltransferase